MFRRRRQVAARVVVALGVVAGVLSGVAPASASYVPETLGDRRPVQAGPVEPGFRIDHVGVIWDSAGRAHDEGVDSLEPHGAVRFRTAGRWGSWQPLVEDGAQADGTWTSGLVPGGDAEAYQVRGLPEGAGRARVAALNTTDGSLVKTGEVRPGTAGAVPSSSCRSRAEWGADEGLRFRSDGTEIMPPTYHPVQVTTVHHTATTNADPNPAATVRAIYRYHAVDNGWGDIGYQYLIDEGGVVYEGRWSGTASASCAAGGTGADFGHESGSDRMVTGAHTGGANSGNLGVALLGTLTKAGAEPATAALGSLEGLLAELMARHRLDPQGTVTFVNPVDGSTRAGMPTISGHRDWVATECPGERLYGRLPTIRANVAASAGADAPPTVALTSPAAGAVVRGSTTLSASASDDVAVTGVTFLVDGVVVATGSTAGDGWTAVWDTKSAAEGSRTVTATATDGAHQTASASATVTVDNVADQTLHVRDLDGVATLAARNKWQASVTTTVKDSGGVAVTGAVVDATWADGAVASCTTDANGMCTVVRGGLSTKGTPSTTLTIRKLSWSGATYSGTDNTDPDRDSNGTTITVRKPT